MQRWYCAAPTPGGKCGQEITEWQCDPMEGPPTGVFRTLVPGPVLTHLPCGHDWWIGKGWGPLAARVPWAEWAER